MFAVEPLASGVSWIRGEMPDNVMFRPDIANVYIFERDGDLTLVDTGAGNALRQVLRRYFAGRRYGSATVINTHNHPDHVCNNVVLEEIDAERKAHPAHPNAVPIFDLKNLVAHEARLSATQEHWVLGLDRPLPARLLSPLVRGWARRSPEAVFRFVLPFFGWFNVQKHKPLGNRTRYRAPLSEGDLIDLRIGSQSFPGWRASDMLIIDDRGHTADSVTVYDPRTKTLLTGDLTFEDNPLWPSGTYQRMIDNLRAFRVLASEGEVAMFGDGHLPRVMTDAGEIVAHFDRLIADHERRRATVLRVARERGLHRVDDVHRAVLEEDPEFRLLSRAGEFPMAYRWTRANVALALREARDGTGAAL